MIDRRLLMFNRLIVLVIITATFFSTAAQRSPWEHNENELEKEFKIVSGESFIKYPAAYTRERELYGYNPRFMPMPVFFDRDNRPYMITAVPPGNKVGDNRSHYQRFSITENAFIQTLDDDGNWVVYDIGEIMKGLFPSEEDYKPAIQTGYNYTHKIFFDEDNRLYFYTVAANPKLSGTLFLYTDSNREKWDSFRFANVLNPSVESYDSFNFAEVGLPTMSYYERVDGGRFIAFAELDKSKSGELIFKGHNRAVSEDAAFSGSHSGYLNFTVTTEGRIHFFWIDMANQDVEDHTTQRTCYFDKKTGRFSEPKKLGSTFALPWTNANDGKTYSGPNTHNGPAVTIDSENVLHVVLGGHGSQAKYTYSTDNGDSWAEAIDLPGENSNNSYPTLITDKQGTVHLVYRATLKPVFYEDQERTGGDYRLSYARKKLGQPWECMSGLVVPGNDSYSIYMQTLTIDRLGRLFLHYYYRADILSERDKQLYRAKWPDAPDPEVQSNIRTHDPVIIMSDDGGDSWRIAKTEDFVNGLTKKNDDNE